MDLPSLKGMLEEHAKIAADRKLAIQPWVDKLGAMTADGIAEFFQGEGIKADRADTVTCAVARFLKDQTGEDIRVHTTRVSDGKTGLSIMVLPETVKEFIQKFDRGEYPDLLVNPFIPQGYIDEVHAYWMAKGNDALQEPWKTPIPLNVTQPHHISFNSASNVYTMTAQLPGPDGKKISWKVPQWALMAPEASKE